MTRHELYRFLKAHRRSMRTPSDFDFFHRDALDERVNRYGVISGRITHSVFGHPCCGPMFYAPFHHVSVHTVKRPSGLYSATASVNFKAIGFGSFPTLLTPQYPSQEYAYTQAEQSIVVFVLKNRIKVSKEFFNRLLGKRHSLFKIRKLYKGAA